MWSHHYAVKTQNVAVKKAQLLVWWTNVNSLNYIVLEGKNCVMCLCLRAKAKIKTPPLCYFPGSYEEDKNPPEWYKPSQHPCDCEGWQMFESADFRPFLHYSEKNKEQKQKRQLTAYLKPSDETKWKTSSHTSLLFLCRSMWPWRDTRRKPTVARRAWTRRKKSTKVYVVTSIRNIDLHIHCLQRWMYLHHWSESCWNALLITVNVWDTGALESEQGCNIETLTFKHCSYRFAHHIFPDWFIFIVLQDIDLKNII